MKYFVDKAGHLVCVPYSIENLHKMAKDLGIHKCHYHNTKKPHYDMPKRMLAKIDEIDDVEVVSSKMIVDIIKQSM